MAESEPEEKARDYTKRPTKRQREYAEELGIEIPEGISRGALSDLIDEATGVNGFDEFDAAWESIGVPASKGKVPKATKKQKDFARDLGVDFPENISKPQIARLIDQALEKRDRERASARVEQSSGEGNQSVGGCTGGCALMVIIVLSLIAILSTL